jgi:hypothetical protein
MLKCQIATAGEGMMFPHILMKSLKNAEQIIVDALNIGVEDVAKPTFP